MENEIKQIGETSYVLKLFPAMTGLSIISRIEKSGGFTEDIILEVIAKGCAIGSTSIDRKKFDKHFAGKYAEMMELFAEILKYNKLFPEAQEAEGEEGNEEGSED